MNLTRRTALKRGAGALTVGGLAGCLDSSAGTQTGFETAYAAFFALWDWSQAVAGDQATVENPVDYGQLGHGWEPDGDLPREVAGTDAFVYLDTPEFAWAQDLASTLEADYETVAAIDALDGLESEMIESGHDHGHGGAHDSEAEHGDAHGSEETHDEHTNETEGEHHDEHTNETEGEHSDEHADDSGGEADRGQLDPHVWVDPVLAQEMVTTICDAFVEIDPDNAESYEANAVAYNERLADLDSRYQQLAADAEQTTAVLATHSSFAYVESRYDFDIHTVAGISPDAEPDASEIAETLDLVDSAGIDVILYDRFESDRLARTIVQNSDATETMAVTAGAGTLQEWADNDWGFIEQMQQVTLPAFRQALGAE